MRAIDADRLLKMMSHWKPYMDMDKVRKAVQNMPTLTSPNEPRMINADKLAKRIAGHSNYHGDSILAAIYCAAEGKENNTPIRPIETPPNEPLTLDELREMDEPTPVWWEKAGHWCLCERGFIIVPNGNIYEFEETDGTFYRRPKEEET